MRVWLLASLVVLAGCADAPAEDDNSVDLGDGSSVTFDDVETSDTLGAITGVVVDDTITPAVGVTVRIVNGPVTTTDEGGVFVFEGLEPGVYFLEVNGTGYGPVQTTADVQAGEVTKMRVILPRDTSKQPYHDTRQFAWFDSVGVTLVDFIIDLTDDAFLGDALPDACDECKFEFESDGAVETFVIEAVWQDQVDHPLGATSFYWNLASTEDWGDYEDDYFQSPGVVHVGDNRWGNITQYTVSMSADETWITLDQRAEMFVTMFYVDAAPEGWSFVAGQ